MNENINLCKILQNCPKGTELYSAIHGKVHFDEVVTEDDPYPILVIGHGEILSFTAEGRSEYSYDGEIMLFPSKDQRDWSKFKPKNPKFCPKTLQPFDRVLARIDGGNAYCWFADFVSTPTIEKYDLLPCIMSNKVANMIIPYNDETKHLVGTTDEAPEYYRYWED